MHFYYILISIKRIFLVIKMYPIHRFMPFVCALLFVFINLPAIGQDINESASEPVGSDGIGTTTITPEVPLAMNPFDSLQKATGVDITADSFDLIGDNIVAEGNLKLRKGDMLLYADKGVVNYTTKTAEVAGNVKMYSLVHMRKELEYWELSQLEKDPNLKIKIVGTLMTASGRQKIVADIIYQNMSWQGKKAIGNLNTGVWEFGRFASYVGGFACLGKSGTKYPDGKFIINEAEVSSCPDLVDGHSIFSLKSAKVVAYPPHYNDRKERMMQTNYSLYPQGGDSNARDYNDTNDEYTAWMYNNLIYVGDIPVFWLPAVYKPRLKDLQNWTIQVGGDSAWGAFVNLTNHWQIYDTDDVSLSLTNMLDFYSQRGVGVGAQAMLETADTKTEIFSYLIPDADPTYNYPSYSRFGQLTPWNVRYDVDVKNLTHLTDNVDFRGRFAKLSDMYFLYAFFNNIALVDPQPATYANLNYEHERFAVSLTARPRPNNFYSVIQQLPTLQLTVPRQEVWKNIHYQADSSIGFNWMTWRNFQYSRSNAPSYTVPGAFQQYGNGVDPANYYSGRFDTTHFAYYPVNLDWVNFLPRAGLKFTAYTNSTSQAVTQNDLNNMLTVQEPESVSDVNVVNYDNDGGWKARFIGEIGASASTKFHRNWSDTKNAFLELDGLRHVIQPYIDYTWISPPTVSRDNLYYFDDVDRITAQNFMRFGVQNRLQTRRGSWANSNIYTWAENETYFDVLFANTENNNTYWNGAQQQYNGLSNFGDFGHRMRLNATDKLTLDFDILFNAQKLTSELSPWPFQAIDKSSLSMTYKLADGWSFTPSWYFGREGMTEGQYSMGSSFTRLQAGSVFLRRFVSTNNLQATLNFKINDRTTGTLSTNYQFQQSLMPGTSLSIARQLPCNLVLLLSATARQQRNDSGSGTNMQVNFGASLAFTASPNYAIQPRDSLLPSSITRMTN